jgi:hypothetical protein
MQEYSSIRRLWIMAEYFPEGKYTGILFLENSIHEYSFVRAIHRVILP